MKINGREYDVRVGDVFGDKVTGVGARVTHVSRHGDVYFVNDYGAEAMCMIEKFCAYYSLRQRGA